MATEATKLKKSLKNLTLAVCKTIRQIDKEMEQPSTKERGSRIAKITNQLELINDKTLHFDLGYSFRQIKNIKNKATVSEQ